MLSPISRFTVCLLCLSFVAPAFGEEWTRFRGPNGRGAAPEADVPLTWTDTENIAWRTELPGPGASSPVMNEDRLFLTCYSGYGESRDNLGEMEDLKRQVVCLDRASGDILWSKTYDAYLPEDPYMGMGTPEHGYASNSMAIDGRRVFAFLGKSGVYAFDLDGNELWHANVGHDSQSRRWGTASSLLVHDGKVIVNSSEESLSVRALDCETGEELWKTPADMLEMAYMTPVLAETKDGRTELIVAVPDEVWGLSLEDGGLNWYVTYPMNGNISPSPIVDGDVIYITGGYRVKGTVAVRAGGWDDATETHTVWTQNDASSYVPSPVLYSGYLYWVDERGNATCLDATTGELVYRERLPRTEGVTVRGNRFYGSATLCGDRIYAPSRFEGTFVLAAKPEYELLAQNRFENDDSRCSSSISVGGDALFLRTDKYLYRIEAR